MERILPAVETFDGGHQAVDRFMERRGDDPALAFPNRNILSVAVDGSVDGTLVEGGLKSHEGNWAMDDGFHSFGDQKKGVPLSLTNHGGIFGANNERG